MRLTELILAGAVLCSATLAHAAAPEDRRSSIEARVETALRHLSRQEIDQAGDASARAWAAAKTLRGRSPETVARAAAAHVAVMMRQGRILEAYRLAIHEMIAFEQAVGMTSFFATDKQAAILFSPESPWGDLRVLTMKLQVGAACMEDPLLLDELSRIALEEGAGKMMEPDPRMPAWLHTPVPSWPAGAMVPQSCAAVGVLMDISDDGRAKNVRSLFLFPHPAFAEEVDRLLRTWRFERGKPVENMHYVFRWTVL